MTTTTAPAALTSAVATPACRRCGRRGCVTTTLCTGAIIVSCPWCGHERVARTTTPAAAAAPVAAAPDPAAAAGMLALDVEGFLF